MMDTSGIIMVKWLVSILLVVHSARAISSSDVFPYGTPSGDQKLNANVEDSGSQEIRLSVEVKFFNRRYKSIFVNENGLLSFLAEIPAYFNVQFPLDYPLIAGLYSDVDCRASGSVWYRVTTDPTLLSRAQSRIQDGFQRSFQPSEIIIVTWDRVGYFERASDKINTFQIVVASNENESFVLLLYPQGGIQWIKAKGKNQNMPDARGQTGIISGEGRHHLVKGSGTDQVRHLDSWSNANEAGLWLFKVGPLDDYENVVEPKVDPRPEFQPETADSCAIGSSLCHSQGRCMDHNPGFCCQCDRNWFGNGQTCLPFGVPQRVNGLVSGDINSISFENQDLHCYVVTEDGRTYTAISKVPTRIGPEMRGLTPLGSPIAWLFSQPVQGAKNGFDVTGGVLNYTGIVRFPDTGHSVTIQLSFLGLDAFDYLKVEGNIRGTLPPINPPTADIILEDYTEEFTKTRPGEITAQSQRSFRIDGTNTVINFEMEHQIRYQGCDYEPANPETRTTRFKSTRNYIVYDGAEQVVRYAMTSQVIPLGAGEDPCLDLVCGPESYCISNDGKARCECNSGFQANADQGCSDIDECAMGMHDCSPNAICYNQHGSYSCMCQPGFIGNGVECIEDVSCDQLQCNENAQCVMDRYGQPSCTCAPGFEGDGTNCTVSPSDMRIMGFSQPEELVFDNANPDRNDPGNVEINHFYQVSNLGPHTVGHVRIEVTWPLKDINDQSLTILNGAPQVKYSGPMGDFFDPCAINADYLSSRVKRQEYDGYDDDIPPYEDLDGISDDDYDLLSYEDEKLLSTYDYSHFDVFNAPPQPTVAQEAPMNYPEELPESSRVEEDSGLADEGTEPKRKKLNGPGLISFTCSVNLAEQESATITIRSTLNVNTLVKSYPGVANFQIPSEAMLVEDESIRVLGSELASVTTQVIPRDPTISLAPGQRYECGATECSKYADCFQAFNGKNAPECRCLPGFKGNGEQCEQLDTMDQDCRQTRNCHSNAVCEFQEDLGIFGCKCKDGFQGDGFQCNLQEETCMTLDNCSPYANCLAEESGRFSCLCMAGYRGNGYTCYPERGPDSPPPPRPNVQNRPGSENNQAQGSREIMPNCYMGSCACPPGYLSCECLFLITHPSSTLEDAGCDLKENCGHNGECVLDADGSHTCRCLKGFKGDGFFCKKDVIGCNVINNCGKYSECLFDYEDRGYRCRCDERRGFAGDGYICKPTNNCQQNPAICDPNAFCVPDGPNGGPQCKCRESHEGDGFLCKPVAAQDQGYLIASQGLALMKIPFSAKKSNPGVPIMVRTSQTATGIDVDCQEQKIYWTDTTGRAIFRCNYDGSQVEPFLNKAMGFPEGLALDVAGRNVFWVDSGKRSIEVARMDSKARSIIIEDNLWNPRGIAVFPPLGQVMICSRDVGF
eukprot:snap_masked-scaffold111_size354240-processed-gene-1.0 protein:Tk11899 transcript:snap_masked-scaffold111_size354240-processed-gene-1.0-mRNA-1 annotation:"hypothetical protein DAPPUDRAFT_314322"